MNSLDGDEDEDGGRKTRVGMGKPQPVSWMRMDTAGEADGRQASEG